MTSVAAAHILSRAVAVAVATTFDSRARALACAAQQPNDGQFVSEAGRGTKKKPSKLTAERRRRNMLLVVKAIKRGAAVVAVAQNRM